MQNFIVDLCPTHLYNSAQMLFSEMIVIVLSLIS